MAFWQHLITCQTSKLREANQVQLAEILTTREKVKGARLLLLITFITIIDSIGVFSIMPFITIAANPDLIDQNQYLIIIRDYLNVDTQIEFIKYFGIILIVFTLFSAALRSFLVYRQHQYVYELERNLSSRLFYHYLMLPYEAMFDKDFHAMSRNILLEVEVIVGKGVMPLLTLFSSSMTTLIITVLVFVVNPLVASLVLILMGLIYFVVLRFTKNKILSHGRIRQTSNLDKTRIIQQSLMCLKEIKANDIEERIWKSLHKPLNDYANSQTISGTLSQVPRYIIEGISFTLILLLCIFLLNDGQHLINFLPYITLIAVSSYRLIPSVQQIFSSITQLRYSKVAIQSLAKDLTDSFSDARPKPTVRPQTNHKFGKSIQIKNLYYNYPKMDVPALQDINITIKPGEFTGIVGTTGSGKTTLIDLLIGLIEPKKGKISLGNEPIKIDGSWRARIGYVPQNVFLNQCTIRENIRFGSTSNENEALYESAKIAEIHEFIINELPNEYETQIGSQIENLSGGQKQRIGIARALYKKPEVLILDEATSALDGETSEKVLQNLKKAMSGKTVILITHNEKTLKYCDQVVELKQGQLVYRKNQ